ncbi:MAG: hypothetical protein Q8O51_02705 [bacterium]|nr:hypothetical protein [bacterium]
MYGKTSRILKEMKEERRKETKLVAQNYRLVNKDLPFLWACSPFWNLSHIAITVHDVKPETKTFDLLAKQLMFTKEQCGTHFQVWVYIDYHLDMIRIAPITLEVSTPIWKSIVSIADEKGNQWYSITHFIFAWGKQESVCLKKMEVYRVHDDRKSRNTLGILRDRLSSQP